MTNFFETPYRKTIQGWNSYRNLSVLNRKKIEEVEGKDEDWLIGTPDNSEVIADPVKPGGSEGENLWKTLELIIKRGKDGSLILSNIILSKGQALETIKNLLSTTQERWRYHLENSDKNIWQKEPVVGLPWQKPTKREKAKEILGWIIDTRIGSMTYEELAQKWNKEAEKDKDYDFDNALFNLNMLLGVSWEYGQGAKLPNSTETILIQALETYLPKERVEEKLGDIHNGWPKQG